MSESFLHYVWQFQYFSKQTLRTTDGEEIQIFHPGMLNSHSGPDFFNARVKIGLLEWVGSVEIHIHASGWYDHRHDADAAYENVILHVVWQNDKPVKRADGSSLPTLELKDLVSEALLRQYKKLVNSPGEIPCAGVYSHVHELTRLSMLDKTLLQRLETKASMITDALRRNNNDWEETCYQLLARNFGFKVNADPFFQLARSVPYKVLLKHADKLTQVEALLFGQGGFLDEPHTEEYFQLLRREHHLLGRKYQLSEKKLHKAQWRFMRLRPANFPTIRIAQFCALLHSRKNLFSAILDAPTYNTLRQLFSVTQSAYWQHHYRFAKQRDEHIPGLGDMSVDNIIINTVVPLLVAYGKQNDEQEWIDRAVAVLQHITAESNTITKKWAAIGQPVRTAFDSQALIELYNNLCSKKRCLECAIGSAILKPHKPHPV